MSITLTLSSGRPINEKRKRKDTPLFIKYLQTAFLKATQLLQCDDVQWQNEAIAKGRRFFLFSTLSYSCIVRIQTNLVTLW